MIHDKYNQITETERELIDNTVEMFMQNAKDDGIKLNGSDPIERVAEAMAVCILESK